MLEKIRSIIKKYREVLSYLFFGVMTTLVNYCIFWPLYNVCALPATLSNVIAWVGAVAFAYVTNKPFVFRSHDWSLKTVVPELGKFVGCRIGSGLIETGIIFITVDVMRCNGNAVKIIVSVLVVLINYVGSKCLVFRKKK